MGDEDTLLSKDGWHLLGLVCSPSTRHTIANIMASMRIVWCSLGDEDPMKGTISQIVLDLGCAQHKYFSSLISPNEFEMYDRIHSIRQQLLQSGEVLDLASTCMTILSLLMQDIDSFLCVLTNNTKQSSASSSPVHSVKPQSLEERLQACSSDEEKAAVQLDDKPILESELALHSMSTFHEYISLHDLISVACEQSLQWHSETSFDISKLPALIDNALPPLTRLIESLELPSILCPRSGHVSQKIVDLAAGLHHLFIKINFLSGNLSAFWVHQMIMNIIRVFLYTDGYLNISTAVQEAVQAAEYTPCEKNNINCATQCQPWKLNRTSAILNSSFAPSSIVLAAMHGTTVDLNAMPASFHVLACKVTNCDNIAYHSVVRDELYFAHADILALHTHFPDYRMSSVCALHLYRGLGCSIKQQSFMPQKYVSHPAIFSLLNNIHWSSSQSIVPWGTPYRVYLECLNVVNIAVSQITNATGDVMSQRVIALLCLLRVGSPLWTELVTTMQLLKLYINVIIIYRDNEMVNYDGLPAYISPHSEITLPDLDSLEQLTLEQLRILSASPIFAMRLSSTFFSVFSNASSAHTVLFPYELMKSAHAKVLTHPSEVLQPLGRYLQTRVKSCYQLNFSSYIHVEMNRQRLNSRTRDLLDAYLQNNHTFINTALQSTCNKDYLAKVNAQRQLDHAKWMDYVIASAGEYMERQEKLEKEKQQRHIKPVRAKQPMKHESNEARKYVNMNVDDVDDSIDAATSVSNTASSSILFVRVRRELNDEEIEVVRKEALRLKEEAIVRNTQPVFTFAYGSLEVSVQESKFDQELEWDSENEEDMDLYTRQVDSLCVLLQGETANVLEWSKVPQHNELLEIHQLDYPQRQAVISAVGLYCREQDDLLAKKQTFQKQKKMATPTVSIEQLEDNDSEEILAQGANGITVSSRDLPLDLLHQILDQEQEEGPPESTLMDSSLDVETSP